MQITDKMVLVNACGSEGRSEMFDITEANVDQIFSRSVKQMRANWVKHEKPR